MTKLPILACYFQVPTCAKALDIVVQSRQQVALDGNELLETLFQRLVGEYNNHSL